ncbi:uncharacterized protein V6R79_004922 [Siganus canaliculatus]
MDYRFFKGFLVGLILQNCMSEDPSTSIQSPTVDTIQAGQALPPEPDIPSADVVPVVAPPSLKEVQQAVLEASEQVEGPGAEEVLKELLERVVEAALGQVEGGGEAKVEGAEKQEEEAALDDDQEETKQGAEGEVLEQAVLAEDTGTDVGDTGFDEDTSEEVAGEDTEDAEVEVETTAGSVEEIARDHETEAEDIVTEPTESEVSDKVAAETTANLDETEGNFAVEEGEVEDTNEPDDLMEDNGTAEIVAQEVDETPDVVEEAEGPEPEQETMAESDLNQAVADEVEEQEVGPEEALQEQIPVDEAAGEAVALPSDSDEVETTQTVVGDPVEAEERSNMLANAEAPEVEDGNGHLVVEVEDTEEVEAESPEGEEIHEETVMKEESVALASEGFGDQQAGGEEQIAVVTSHGSEEGEEVLVISAPGPEGGADTTVEQSPENQASTSSPSLDEENTHGEKPSHANEIITPADDLLPHDPVEAQPTSENFVTDVLVKSPQAEGEEPGETNELVEETETSELGLDVWKIGAISAAVFLVLETIVIVIYVLKCRNKNSTPDQQRACEEGCVEPEAATGGDCSEETLPAGNGDTQQIAALDPSDVPSSKEQHEEGNAIAMSDLQPSSTEESANTGNEPDSSQDLRTSVL